MRRTWIVLTGASCLCCSAPVSAIPLETQPLDLEHDKALRVLVSFEAKRRPVQVLLNELGLQSGLSLSAATGSAAATALVTARVEKMAVGDVMGALATLYGATWSRSGATKYIMNAGQEPIVDARIRELGDLKWFRYWRPTLRSLAPKTLDLEPPTDWGAEILPLVDYHAFLKKGIAFASLPEDLQRRFREEVESQYAESIIRNYSRGSEASLLARGWLEVGRFSYSKTPAGIRWGSPTVRIGTTANAHVVEFPLVPRDEATALQPNRSPANAPGVATQK